jgi:hypothetical protein
MSEKLLPCPFCGSTSLEILPEDPDSEGNAWGAVQCVNLDCPTYDGFRSHGVRVGDGQDVSDERGSDAYKSQAIAAWNRRTPAPEVEAVAWRVRRPKAEAGFGRPQVFLTEEASDGDFKQWRRNGYEVQPLYASPVVPVGREEIARTLYEATPARVIHPLPIHSLSWDDIKTDDPARADRAYREADAILAALGTKPTDTGREE